MDFIKFCKPGIGLIVNDQCANGPTELGIFDFFGKHATAPFHQSNLVAQLLTIGERFASHERIS